MGNRVCRMTIHANIKVISSVLVKISAVSRALLAPVVLVIRLDAALVQVQVVLLPHARVAERALGQEVLVALALAPGVPAVEQVVAPGQEVLVAARVVAPGQEVPVVERVVALVQVRVLVKVPVVQVPVLAS